MSNIMTHSDKRLIHSSGVVLTCWHSRIITQVHSRIYRTEEKMCLLVKTLRSDTFYIVIVSAFMYMTSVPCPWFRRPSSSLTKTFNVLAILASFLVSFTLTSYVDLKMLSLKSLISNFMILLFFMTCAVLLTYQLTHSDDMREVVDNFEPVLSGFRDRSYRINRSTRIAIILFTFLKALMFSAIVTNNLLNEMALFYMNILQTTLLCEWAVLLSIICHGFSNTKYWLKSCVGQMMTRQLQEHCVSLTLHIFRHYKNIFRKVNTFFSVLLLAATVNGSLSILISFITVLKISIVGETYTGQTILNCVMLVDSTITILIVCTLSYQIQNQVIYNFIFALLSFTF